MGDEILANIIKFFRLLPFVLVSYFLIIGTFGRQFKYFLVFLGLMITLFITTMISRSEFVRDKIFVNGTDANDIASQIKKYSIFTIDFTPVSYIPLSIGIYAFILIHYIYILFSYDKTVSKKNRKHSNVVTQTKYISNNWGILVFLLALLILDCVWYYKGGFTSMALLIPVLMGVIGGTVWALLIGRDNWAIPTGDTNKTCQPSEMSYSCKMTTTGDLIKTQ